MRRDWVRILKDFKESGESQADYSRRTGVSASELSKQLRRQPTKPTSFVRLDTEELKLELGNGVVARLPLTRSTLELLLTHARSK